MGSKTKIILDRQTTNTLQGEREKKKKRWFFALAFSFASLVLVLVSLYVYPLADRLKKNLDLKLKNLEFRGMKMLTREKLLADIGIDPGSDVLNIDLKEVERGLLRDPFVKSAEIIRVLPDTLLINIVERKPMAILRDEEPWYVDDQAIPFKTVEASEGDRFDYAVLTGVPRGSMDASTYRDSVIKQSLSILNLLVSGKIVGGGEVSEINFSEIYGFSMYLGRKPVRVVLGFEDIREKLSRLKEILTRLKNRLALVSLIDLDYEEKAVVRLKEAI